MSDSWATSSRWKKGKWRAPASADDSARRINNSSITDEDIQHHRKQQFEKMTGIPLRYLDMMKDIHSEAAKADNDRPLKKRKRKTVSTEDATAKSQEPNNNILQSKPSAADQGGNTVDNPVTFTDGDSNEDENEEESSEEEDEFDWEEVDLEADNNLTSNIMDETLERSANSSEKLDEPITVSLSSEPGKSSSDKKQQKKTKPKILNKEEKVRRVLVHKLHLLCLLHHVWVRNRWCNDYSVRENYKYLLSPTILQELHPPAKLSSTLKTRKFLDGLRHAMNAWKKKFRVTSKGLYMVSWSDIFRSDRPLETKMELPKFRSRLHSLRGSRDLGAQGFCALLRAVNVEARLVCSLQPLDFTSTSAVETNPQNGNQIPVTINTNYPLYWVEAWDPSSEKWVSIDPIVTDYVDIIRSQTKNKLEPPISDRANSLRYVVSFDFRGHAVDVTRRYSQNFNSKTRKKRVTSVSHKGSVWWDKVMNIYKPRTMPSRREQMEVKELELRQSAEGFPTNVQDFKGHPIYALKRHLHRDELISENAVPCGNFTVRKGVTEPVYFRKDLKIVKTAKAWYKLGRIVKSGSQPLKYQPKRRNKNLGNGDDDYDDDGENESAMYALDQTELYVPQPVEKDGKIPKNAFGNLDIYVRSMIPQGAVHLKEQYMNIAAKLVEVDYADAVIGFTYANRRMTPKIQGIIVAKEHEEAVKAAYNQLLEEQREENEKEKFAKALLKWRRYLVALRIKDRLNRVHGEIEGPGIASDEGQNEQESDDANSGGGFIKDDVVDISDDSDSGGGFLTEAKTTVRVSEQDQISDLADLGTSNNEENYLVNTYKETNSTDIDEQSGLFEQAKLMAENLPKAEWNEPVDDDENEEMTQHEISGDFNHTDQTERNATTPAEHQTIPSSVLKISKNPANNNDVGDDDIEVINKPPDPEYVVAYANTREEPSITAVNENQPKEDEEMDEDFFPDSVSESDLYEDDSINA